jgi:hypothetical protein
MQKTRANFGLKLLREIRAAQIFVVSNYPNDVGGDVPMKRQSHQLRLLIAASRSSREMACCDQDEGLSEALRRDAQLDDGSVSTLGNEASRFVTSCARCLSGSFISMLVSSLIAVAMGGTLGSVGSECQSRVQATCAYVARVLRAICRGYKRTGYCTDCSTITVSTLPLRICSARAARNSMLGIIQKRDWRSEPWRVLS